jgi:hypothetical protein
MASKRAAKGKQCGSKVRHETQPQAAAARRALIKHKGWTGTINTYRCPFCGGWHIGRTGW